MKTIQNTIYKIPNTIFRWLTATRLRKMLSSTLALLMLLTSLRFLFFTPKEVKAADVYLGFDEGYGTSSAVNDRNGSVSAGSITNAVWKTEDLCKEGKCLYFDGTGDYVSFADDVDLDMAASDSVTVELWFRTPDITSGTRTLISKEEATGADGGYRIEMNSSGQIVFGIDSDNSGYPLYSVTTPSSYDDNSWHFISAVKDGTSSITLYMDGGLPKTASIASTAADNDDSFYIGSYYSGSASNGFMGFIDEVKVLRSARTESEVKTDFVSQTPDRGVAASFGPDQSYLSQGLLGYWKMDETATPSVDSSGNGNSGTWGGNIAAGSGKYGNASVNDGTNDYIQVADSTNLEIPATNSITLAGWFKTSSATNNLNIVSKNGNAINDIYSLYLSYGFIEFDAKDSNYLGAASILGTTGGLRDGTWHHAAAVYDRNKNMAYIYLDGKLDATNTATVATGAIGQTGNLYIGATSTTDNEFAGSLDEIRIYNRALSPTEISQLYSWAPGPVGYWKLDEGTGTTAYDTSGNAVAGTSYNGASFEAGKYGSAGKFDGSNDFFDLGNNKTSLKLGSTKSLTVEAWVYFNNISGDSEIVSNKMGYDTSGIGWELYQFSSGNGGDMCAYVSDGTNSSDTCTGSLTGTIENHWEHWVMTFDRSTRVVTLYRNGVKPTQTPSTAASMGSTDNTNVCARIGARANNETVCSGEATVSYHNGLIDEVKVYDYVRTPGQIIEDMNAGHPAPGSPVGSPTLWWKLDEGYSTAANDSGSSGTYDGTLSGTTWINAGKFGKGVTMDSYAEYISAGDVAFLDSATQMTAVLWLNPANLEVNRDIFSKSNHASQNQFRINISAGASDEIEIYIPSSITDETIYYTTSNLNLTTGSWQQVIVVYDGTAAAADRIKVYKNANLINGSITGTIPTSLTTGSTSNLTLGDRSGNPNNALITSSYDEVKLYNLAMTADQVKAEYNRGAAEVWGSTGTTSTGASSNSSTDEYCPPGQGSTCVGPVAEWKLDENTSTTANDTSSNTKTATITAGTGGWVPGYYGSAFSFDNANTKIQTNSTYTTPSSITVTAWIYYIGGGEGSAGRIVSNLGASEIRFWNCSTQALCFRYPWSTGSVNIQSVDNVFEFNKWQYIAVTYDGTGSTNRPVFYKNGQVVATGTDFSNNSGSISPQTDNWVVGNREDQSATFYGYLDNVRIYDYARTPAQIAWDYNRGDPVGWWKLDENQTGDGQTAYDASGNGNNGTTEGGTGNLDCTVTGKHNKACDFDGSDDYIDMGNQTTHDFADDRDFSVEAWVNRESFTTIDTIVAKSNNPQVGGTSAGYGIYIQANDIVRMNVSDGTNETNCAGPSTITEAGWNHIVAAYFSNPGGQPYCILYLNGNPGLQGASGSTASPTNSVNFRVGSESDTGQPFDGKIDEVKIFNYALNATQVKNEYAAGTVNFGY